MNNCKNFLLLVLALSWSILLTAQPKENSLSEKARMDFDRYFFAGLKDKMIRNMEDAETEFKSAAKIDPSNANIHFQIATVLLAQKKTDETIFYAEKAFKLNSNNEWYAKFLIELYRKEKRFEDAAKVCEIAYKQNQQSHYLIELSQLYLQLNKPQKAISVLNQLEKKQGITEQISREKEEIFLGQNKLKDAVKEIEKLSNAFPEELQYKGMLADLYMVNKRQPEALIIYNQILEKDPLNGFASFSLADYYQQRGDLDKCFENLSQGMRSNMDPKYKLQVLSRLIPSSIFGDNHRERSKELVQIFSASNPTAFEPYLFKGDIFLQERKLEEAREQYLIAIEKNNASFLAWEQVLFCDQQLGRYDYLKSDCSNLIEIFPNNPIGYLYHSLACKNLKEFDLALQSARAGLENADNEEMTIQLLSNLGDIANYAKRFDVSDSAFEALIAIDPKNSLALNNYAYFLSLRLVDLDKAENMSRLSIELDPNNPSNLDTYGWILYQKKNFESAKVYIEKSLSLSPNNAEVVEHLGDVLYRLNQKEQALEKWILARTLGVNSKELDLKIESKNLPLP